MARVQRTRGWMALGLALVLSVGAAALQQKQPASLFADAKGQLQDLHEKPAAPVWPAKFQVHPSLQRRCSRAII